MHFDEVFNRSLGRRSVLKAGAAAAVASQAALLEQLVVTPMRPAFAATAFSDIQFDIGAFVHPAQTFNDGAGNVVAQFGVVFALFVPAKLTRTPNVRDQAKLANALATIEASFPASPAGMFVHVSWGLPYFARLPRAVVAAHMPRLLSNQNRSVLEEATAFPTDVVGGLVGGPRALIPNRKKDRFNINVAIERNDVVFHLRSDSVANLVEVFAWMEGSGRLNGRAVTSPDFDGLFAFQTPRLQFVQPGLPRKVADAAAAMAPDMYEFHTRINPDSPMTMGFADQMTDSAAPAALVTFAGINAKIPMTTARAGDYFDNGSLMHLSHDIEDLYQFYALPKQDSNRPDGEPYDERVQYMFRNNQVGTTNGLPAQPNADAFTNGGGPAFVNNVFQGFDAAMRGARDSAGKFGPGNQSKDATFTGLGRVGHESALQQVGRAADGTPLHIRIDGPGFDSLDVPAFRTFPGANGVNVAAGSNQFKLEFAVFMPTADLFARMRTAAAAQDLQHQFLGDADDDNGLERFITATRRQNFLTPPRRHRSFPLLELAAGGWKRTSSTRR